MKHALAIFTGCIVLIVVQKAWAQDDSAEKVSSLQKKCMVELRHQFIPKNCYRWVEFAALRPERRKYLHQWFDSVCKKALYKNESLVQHHVHDLSQFSQDCQKHLELAFTQWSYKSKSENPEKVIQLMVTKNGKELEYSSVHDQNQPRSHRNTRSPRRRLN